MKPIYKSLLLAGLLLILIGLCVSVGAFFGGASFTNVQKYYRDGYTKNDWSDNGEDEVMNDSIVFDKSELTSIDISLELADVTVTKGSSFEIQTYDIPVNEIQTSLSNDGTLIISNRDMNQMHSIFNGRWTNRNPRIVITLPNDLELTNFNLKIGAGRFSSKEITIQADKASLEVGAGEIVFQNLNTERMTAHCGMGSLTISGKIKGSTKLECGMGSVSVRIDGDIDEYSYNASVGLGNVKINNDEISGFGNKEGSKRLSNHIDIDCGMGNVKVIIE